jgi:hypothetical protein
MNGCCAADDETGQKTEVLELLSHLFTGETVFDMVFLTHVELTMSY